MTVDFRDQDSLETIFFLSVDYKKSLIAVLILKIDTLVNLNHSYDGKTSRSYK